MNFQRHSSVFWSRLFMVLWLKLMQALQALYHWTGTSAHTIVFLFSKSFFTLLFIIFYPSRFFNFMWQKSSLGAEMMVALLEYLLSMRTWVWIPRTHKKMPGIVCACKSNGMEAEANGFPRQALGLVRYPLARLQWRACLNRLKVTTSCLMTWVQSPGVIGLKERTGYFTLFPYL